MPSQYLIKLLHKCSWWKQFNFHFCFIIEVLIVWHIISIFFLTGLIWIKSGYAAGCKKVLNYGGTNFPLPVNVTEHFPSPCSSDLHIIHISIYNLILQYIFSISFSTSKLKWNHIVPGWNYMVPPRKKKLGFLNFWGWKKILAYFCDAECEIGFLKILF